MKYRIELEANFKKGDCDNCPILFDNDVWYGCSLNYQMDKNFECPLEEIGEEE